MARSASVAEADDLARRRRHRCRQRRAIFQDDACWEVLDSPEAVGITGVTARRDSLYEGATGGRVQYLGDPDNTGRYGAVICYPNRMILPDDWIMPIYEGVERLAVSAAVAIVPDGY